MRQGHQSLAEREETASADRPHLQVFGSGGGASVSRREYSAQGGDADREDRARPGLNTQTERFIFAKCFSFHFTATTLVKSISVLRHKPLFCEVLRPATLWKCFSSKRSMKSILCCSHQPSLHPLSTTRTAVASSVVAGFLAESTETLGLST